MLARYVPLFRLLLAAVKDENLSSDEKFTRVSSLIDEYKTLHRTERAAYEKIRTLHPSLIVIDPEPQSSKKQKMLSGLDSKDDDKAYTNAFIKAVELGEDRIVKLLIDAKDEELRDEKDAQVSLKNWVDTTHGDPHDQSDYNALLMAAAKGHVAVVQHLLDAKADVEYQNSKRNTPLIMAARNDNADVVTILLQAGANKEHQNHHDKTAVLKAAARNSLKCIKVLHEANADFKVVDHQRNTVLMRAAEHNANDVARYILQNQLVDINAVNLEDHSAIDVCIKHGARDVAFDLIQAGVSVQGKMDFLLSSGFYYFNPTIAGLLLDYDKSFHRFNALFEMLAKEIVVCNGDDVLYCLNWLQQRNPQALLDDETHSSSHACNPEKLTYLRNKLVFLHFLARLRFVDQIKNLCPNMFSDEAVNLIVEYDPHLTMINLSVVPMELIPPPIYPLFKLHEIQSEERCAKSIQILGEINTFQQGMIKQHPELDLKADYCRQVTVNAVTEHGMTALMNAVFLNDYETVRLLIYYGADVNVSRINANAFIPILMLAIEMGFSKIAELLINCGANVDATDYRNGTALHYAARYSRYETAVKLISRKANIDTVDEEKLTPLDIAADQKDFPMIHLLFKHTATYPKNPSGFAEQLYNADQRDCFALDTLNSFYMRSKMLREAKNADEKELPLLPLLIGPVAPSPVLPNSPGLPDNYFHTMRLTHRDRISAHVIARQRFLPEVLKFLSPHIFTPELSGVVIDYVLPHAMYAFSDDEIKSNLIPEYYRLTAMCRKNNMPLSGENYREAHQCLAVIEQRRNAVQQDQTLPADWKATFLDTININARATNREPTLLIQAIDSSEYEVALALVEAKADVNLADASGFTPLLLLAHSSRLTSSDPGEKIFYLNLIRMLITAGGNVQRKVRGADFSIFGEEVTALDLLMRRPLRLEAMSILIVHWVTQLPLCSVFCELMLQETNIDNPDFFICLHAVYVQAVTNLNNYLPADQFSQLETYVKGVGYLTTVAENAIKKELAPMIPESKEVPARIEIDPQTPFRLVCEYDNPLERLLSKFGLFQIKDISKLVKQVKQAQMQQSQAPDTKCVMQ